jgi:hypothetical protein
LYIHCSTIVHILFFFEGFWLFGGAGAFIFQLWRASVWKGLEMVNRISRRNRGETVDIEAEIIEAEAVEIAEPEMVEPEVIEPEAKILPPDNVEALTARLTVVPMPDRAAGKNGRQWGLTHKQEAFCVAMLSGCGSQSEAYRLAYDCDNMEPPTIWQCASRLMANAKVIARLDHGFAKLDRQMVRSGASLRAHISRELLNLSINGDTDANRIKALTELGKLYEVSAFAAPADDDDAEELEAEELEAELRAQLVEAFKDTA